MKRFVAELQRRNVPKTAVAYLAGAWLLIEVTETIFPRIGLDDALVSTAIVLLAIGFVPALILSWFFELTPDGLKLDDASNSAPEQPARTTKTADRVIVIMLLAAVAVLAVDKFVLDPARDTERLEQVATAARTDAVLGSYGDKSIAVLAFDDMSPAKDQEYFSDGIAEELLNMLSTVKELRVISRSSAFSFKGKSATVPEIADKLGVSFVLEGSVRKAGNRIRVTAQLIDARTDTHMWSNNFDRELDDIFAIQDEISLAIVKQLKLSLVDGPLLTEKIDPALYEKYLRAQFIVHSSKQDQFREAQRLLNEVLATAPNYIPALNSLGRLYYRIPKSEGLTGAENQAEIEKIANRVIAIDPDGISSLIWQGFFAFERNDLQEAAQFYERAIRIDPNNTSLLRVLVSFLTRIGRIEDAVALGQYLLLRDPACSACVSNLAEALRAMGEPQKSIEVMKSLLDWHSAAPGFYWGLGVTYLVAGDPQEAMNAFEKEVLDGNREMGITMALHDLGRQADFESRFAALREGNANSESIARIYAWIGERDLAFEWLDRMAREDGSEMVGNIDTDLYEKIKTDPRWEALRAAHGFGAVDNENIEFSFTLPAGAPQTSVP